MDTKIVRGQVGRNFIILLFAIFLLGDGCKAPAPILIPHAEIERCESQNQDYEVEKMDDTYTIVCRPKICGGEVLTLNEQEIHFVKDGKFLWPPSSTIKTVTKRGTLNKKGECIYEKN